MRILTLCRGLVSRWPVNFPMSPQPNLVTRVPALVLGLVLLAQLPTAAVLEAQTVTNVIDAFNPAGTGTNSYAAGLIGKVWANWFGGAFRGLAWDPTSDANNNPNSGSLKITNNYPVSTDQFTVWNGINGISPALNGVLYTNFQCDIRFAAGSATTSGNFGTVQFGMGTPSYGQDYWPGGSVTVAASNTNWVHVSIPLNVSTDANLYNIANVFIHIWGAGLVGPSTLWVDNIAFVGVATNAGTAVLNYTNTQQRIDGFGASCAWYNGMTTADADLLFSTNKGVGMSFLRTRIAPGGVIDDGEGTIAQLAQARGARVWSTPWSPAVIFKNTNTVNGGSYVDTPANNQALASEVASYVGAMKYTYGVNLYAVSVQNEPDVSIDYESCLWTSQQIHDYVPALAAALVASNFTNTKIILPEDEFWKWDLATNTMSDTNTASLVGILAAHNYNNGVGAVTAFGTPCPKTIWETEHYLGTDDSITNGLQLAQEMHAFLTVAQASAYHYWWLTGSGTGSIADNTANPAKRLYVMGNYSLFVRPNFYRFGATNTSAALVSAYKDTNSANFVIVAANPNAIAVNQTFILTNFPSTGTLTQWVTSATLSLSNQGPVAVTNGIFNYILQPYTVITFTYVPPAVPVIVQQPAGETATYGSSATFTISASGGMPLNYQWLFNRTNFLLGATNASLTLTGLTPANAGNYSVIVTNYLGSITSSVAALTLVSAPGIPLVASDGLGYSSFDTVADSGGLAQANWQGGQWPSATNNYFTGPYTLRTPASTGSTVFSGNSLTIQPGGAINLKGANGAVYTLLNGTNTGGSINEAVAGTTYFLAGSLVIASNCAFQAGSDATRTLVLSNILSGTGTLTNNFGPGTIAYSGNATAFNGPLIISQNVTLTAGSQTNLGGNPASFNPAQFVLDGGIFAPSASLALTNVNSGVTLTTNGGTLTVASGLALTVANPIAGPGGLIITGGGTLLLTGTNTFTGGTTLSNGVLAVFGGAPLTSTNLTITAGGTLDVSALTVPLTVTNQLALAGNAIVTVNSAGGSSRLLAGQVIYGGTLTLSNTGPALVAGKSFALFTASHYSGAFTAIKPATPGTGLVWDTSRLAVNGTLLVGAAPGVSVTPAVTSITYGDPLVLTAVTTGTGPLAWQWYDNNTNAIPGAVYAILTNLPMVSGSGNYRVVATNGVGRATNFAKVTVNKAVLTVAANSTNRPYAAPNPVLTASYTGFVNGDTFGTAVSGAPALATSATISSAPGSYLIVCPVGTLAATNYSFSFVNGVLTVTSAGNPTNLVSSVSGSTLTLNWPLDHLGWTLQAQTNVLGGGLGQGWVDVAGSAAVTQWVVPLDATQPTVFYRLRQ